MTWEIWQSADGTETTMIGPGGDEAKRERLTYDLEGRKMILLHTFEADDHDAARKTRDRLLGWD
jgi:hypothetical protein